MSGQWVDFRKVKETVSMDMVLAHYGVQLHPVAGSRLRGRCPLPSHVSQDSSPSFAVDVARNIWACHSDSCVAARSGRLGGNVLDFVASMENCSIRNAALRIESWFPSSAALDKGTGGCSALPPPVGSLALPFAGGDSDSCEVLGFQLWPVDTAHEYLHRRGIDRATAEHFGSGFYAGPGIMNGRVVIPIHDGEGELIGYAGRALDATQPRYRFPTGFRKSLVLFNLHRAITARSHGTVVVVEGFFDCLKVFQAGVRCVVALMGCTMTAIQERLLVENFQHVVLFLDGDDAGRSASSEIAARLVRRLFVRVVDTPSGVQPDEMPLEHIRAVLKPAMDCASDVGS